MWSLRKRLALGEPCMLYLADEDGETSVHSGQSNNRFIPGNILIFGAVKTSSVGRASPVDDGDNHRTDLTDAAGPGTGGGPTYG